MLGGFKTQCVCFVTVMVHQLRNATSSRRLRQDQVAIRMLSPDCTAGRASGGQRPSSKQRSIRIAATASSRVNSKTDVTRFYVRFAGN